MNNPTEKASERKEGDASCVHQSTLLNASNATSNVRPADVAPAPTPSKASPLGKQEWTVHNFDNLKHKMWHVRDRNGELVVGYLEKPDADAIADAHNAAFAAERETARAEYGNLNTLAQQLREQLATASLRLAAAEEQDRRHMEKAHKEVMLERRQLAAVQAEIVEWRLILKDAVAEVSSKRMERIIESALSKPLNTTALDTATVEARQPLVDGLHRLYALRDVNCQEQAKRAYDAALAAERAKTHKTERALIQAEREVQDLRAKPERLAEALKKIANAKYFNDRKSAIAESALAEWEKEK